MCERMYVCIHVYMNTCERTTNSMIGLGGVAYMCVYLCNTRISVYIHIYIYVCMYVCMYTCICVSVPTSVRWGGEGYHRCVCMYVHTQMHIHTYTCVCMYDTHTQINILIYMYICKRTNFSALGGGGVARSTKGLHVDAPVWLRLV